MLRREPPSIAEPCAKASRELILLTSDFQLLAKRISMLMILLLLAALSLGLSLLFTPIIRTAALRCNLVDVPDNNRKVHKTPIPRVGGVALGFAYFGALLLVAVFIGNTPQVAGGFAVVKLITPAALVVFFIGLADDIFDLKAWHKFAVQIAAAGMVVAAGIHIQSIPALNIHPVLAALVSILWLVACTNAVNLIDGLDGLAAGISFVATMTAFIASLVGGNVGLSIATAPLAGALLGFLVFNFNPASIFLGDSGSLLLGFLLGCQGILWSNSSASVLEMTAPLMAVAVPLVDTTLAITRRFLSGHPIFKADRSHIHHRLLARGLSHIKAVLLLYAAAAMAGALSLCLIWANDRWEGVVVAAFACAVVFGVRQLDYAEFQLLRKIVLFSGSPNSSGQLTQRSVENSFEAATPMGNEEQTPVFSGKPFETQRRPAA
jgi:UDP-GlcNAc:undecaprenyl-phosphate GlcNAc-1-phosphate transferase